MEKSIIFDNGRLICVGQEHMRIPTVLARLHGESVRQLDLSHNQLLSLRGLELFPALEELILDDNSISEGTVVPHIPTLTTLSLNKNKVENLEVFLKKVATGFPKLRFLSLLGNIGCPDQLSNSSHDEEDYARYRCFVVHHLPKLAFLDSSPVTAVEISEAKRRGHLLRPAKPLIPRDEYDSSANGEEYLTPLPSTRREISDHQGAYGKCRYKYSGKHSEGNRFIQNNDL